MIQELRSDSLLGQLPQDLQEQALDILLRILKLAGYGNSNTDSNSVGGTSF